MAKIRLAIAGVGNCASSLVQGIAYYRSSTETNSHGLMHPLIGSWRCGDIEVVAAFDVDVRKVGRTLSEAILARPNCTRVLGTGAPPSEVVVQMGPVLDGVAAHMNDYPHDRAIVAADVEPVDVARVLEESGAEILVNYLPVGSEQAVRHYAQACLEAGVALVNCVPVFLASDPAWGARFAAARLPLIGDDVKSQVGATIVHRTLAKLFTDRGVKLDHTYQLNVGGNADFLNMLARDRLVSKKISKTESVQSQLGERLDANEIHIGPSDYVPWLEDRKVCFIRMEGLGFGGSPIELELRLSVHDSPNSAGVVIDAIRCAKLALERGEGGALEAVSAFYMKNPPTQMADPEALRLTDRFIAGRRPA